ncbi:MAG TPA: hypothetical protein DDZ68_07320 [Parvularcula sp.]|nr:hypothetical protein [Parvularcula sp.]HBS32115.1 hypothetical protein [Parvularcula sp.]HBS33715.1 hypothetical protein [Parvularcula sp.]
MLSSLTSKVRSPATPLPRAKPAASPAAAVVGNLIAALERCIKRSDRVILFNCGAGVRHPAAQAGPVIDP